MSQTTKLPNSLIILAFLADLLTPLLIWKGILPGGFRWISHAAVILMIGLVPIRMLAFNRIPVSFWIIVVLSLVGIFTAIFTGQGFAATMWGWWLMFQYPLVGLFAYLQPDWPKGFSKKFLTLIVCVLMLEVFVQLGQYFTGETPGDNLAGTFGENGTSHLILFLNLVLCFALGDWLEKQRWTFLAPTLVFGFSASILGEIKFFLVVMGFLGLFASVFYAFKSKRLLNLIPYALLMSLFVLIFIPAYNLIVPSARDIPVDRYFRDEQLVEKYLNLTIRTPNMGSTYYDLGRNYAASYGWDQITSDPFTLIFGYGIGARSESKTLGIVGRALEQGNLGITSGTSLLIIMQETGLLGLFSLLVFMIAVVSNLYKQSRMHPDSDINGLRYGLILFTLLWPLWLWYNTAWILRVPMLIYWVILGYVMGKVERKQVLNPVVSEFRTQLVRG
jgi:hypothetical protein